ncbi:hypothetical protein I546_7063 [Mycobacterium kansasii 732]|uniref:35 kDa protein n=1 Tax=Mycobacterium pseudokansasii TaxID=2341080 RepID=A0A498QNT2_9MYCO|nr:hypothetical protein [Mycobacterium pseudokansasii]ETZ97683.1 hypothetical protein I546_7063 [Mycobacterium kansasii 732]KZS63930.1 hypothetical protein A4G27_26825 [Mycobacterium kansasii]MBY0390359.1 hypothetical protein [Mycobacterium pseudokansasii]VAZ94926.1 35 kDa protein [Mycobacterium pseudokansasii]VAZ96031.1 35 kDa protein [Mycobacterium pseudokansasii]
MPDEPAAQADQSDAGSTAGYDPGYDPAGVPTFESVREKIESRYATAMGAAELDADTTQGRSVEEQYEKRQRAAAERLARIRESMRTDE